MKYHLYLDESRDHGLSFIDHKFPIFLLCGVLISDDEFTLLHHGVQIIKKNFWNTFLFFKLNWNWFLIYFGLMWWFFK